MIGRRQQLRTVCIEIDTLTSVVIIPFRQWQGLLVIMTGLISTLYLGQMEG